MTTKLPYPTYDADNHFYETEEALTRYLPKQYKNAVQYVKVGDRTKLAIGGLITDYIPNPTFHKVAAPGSQIDWYAGNNPEGLSMREFTKVVECHPAWKNADERLKLLDEQGLDATLNFPTLASAIEERLSKYDIDAMTAVMHGLNRWILDEWSFNREDRIYTAPIISLANLDWAISELEWALKNGAKTVLIRPAPVPGVAGSRSFAFEEFDPFWARVAESGIFISMHGSDTGYDVITRMWVGGSEYLPFMLEPFTYGLHPGTRAITDSMLAMVCHGLFDRHPSLRIAAIENGGAWVSELLENMSQLHKMFPKEFKADPVEQFREHVYIAPFFEDALSDLREVIGAERILFGSDYPHPEGCALPLEFEGQLHGFTDDEKRKVMGGNLMKLLNVA